MKKGAVEFGVLILSILLFLSAIFLFSFVSGSASIGKLNYSIKSIYEPGDMIDGWINLSLANEPTTSTIKNSFGGSINLLELLNKGSNSGFVKTCNTLDCVSSYVASNPQTSKTFNLGENQSIILGLNIIGNARDLLTDISDFTFNLSSNSPETEKFPLAIDILNDGSYEWNAYKAADSFGDENKGCFIYATGQAIIAGASYCEKIRLQRTPEVEIGAYVQGIQAGIDFSMKITSFDGLKSESCTTNPTIGGNVEVVNCIVPDFSVNEIGDYFVCIKADPMDINKYKINIEEDEIKCGFSSQSGSYEGSYNYDFEIYARPKKYLGGINFSLNNNELVNAKSYLNNIEAYLKEYISEVYGNNCSNGCVMPIKIYSGVSQQISLSGTYGSGGETIPHIISYTAGISTFTDKFYDVVETPALINSGFQKLFLNGSGFSVPMETGNYTLSISMNRSSGEQELLSQKIRVSIPEPPKIKALIPNRTGVKYPTLFSVLLNETANITKYGWNFGDNQTQNTTKGEVTHTYDKVGSYTMKVSLFGSSGIVLSSRDFIIVVAPASTIVPELLDESEARLNQIKAQMKSNFSAFEQKAINKSLNLPGIESKIKTLKTSVAQAGTDETKFENILGELLTLKIPDSVAKTAYTDSFAFYPTVDAIDLDALKQVGGGDYETGMEEAYKQAVLAWEGININSVMIYTEISSIYPDYQQPLLKTFDLRIVKAEGSGNAYIIMRDMSNLLFKEDYSQEKVDGYYSIDFDSSEKRIVFSTTENVDFFTLPLFVSPPISELNLVEIAPPEKQTRKWIIYGIVVALVLGIAAVTWFILKVWYKRKYETYLFKNRNNLYNLVNYIQNEKIKGTNEGDIAAKLKKAGWSSEQLRYALRKHAGKPTGMPELIRLRKKSKMEKIKK